MIRPGQTSKPGILQDMLAQHLVACGAADDVNNVLSKFRICASRERMRLRDIEKVNTKLLKRWDLKDTKYWLAFVTYDNLGWRILGARAGYAQYVFILVQFISPAELRAVGF
jgi:hypothetical protein